MQSTKFATLQFNTKRRGCAEPPASIHSYGLSMHSVRNSGYSTHRRATSSVTTSRHQSKPYRDNMIWSEIAEALLIVFIIESTVLLRQPSRVSWSLFLWTAISPKSLNITSWVRWKANRPHAQWLYPLHLRRVATFFQRSEPPRESASSAVCCTWRPFLFGRPRVWLTWTLPTCIQRVPYQCMGHLAYEQLDLLRNR